MKYEGQGNGMIQNNFSGLYQEFYFIRLVARVCLRLKFGIWTMKLMLRYAHFFKTTEIYLKCPLAREQFRANKWVVHNIPLNIPNISCISEKVYISLYLKIRVGYFKNILWQWSRWFTLGIICFIFEARTISSIWITQVTWSPFISSCMRISS